MMGKPKWWKKLWMSAGLSLPGMGMVVSTAFAAYDFSKTASNELSMTFNVNEIDDKVELTWGDGTQTPKTFDAYKNAPYGMTKHWNRVPRSKCVLKAREISRSTSRSAGMAATRCTLPSRQTGSAGSFVAQSSGSPP